MSDLPGIPSSTDNEKLAQQQPVNVSKLVERIPKFEGTTIPDILPWLARAPIGISIVPGYEKITSLIAGRPGPVSYILLVHASSTGTTSRSGTSSLPVNEILEMFRRPEKMFKGLNPWSSNEEMFSDRAVLLSAPVTVVSVSQKSPAIITSENVNLKSAPYDPQPWRLWVTWESPIRGESWTLDTVRVNSFNLTGEPSGNIKFAWHMDLQIAFEVWLSG